MMKDASRLSALGLLVALAGCGGGGGSAAMPASSIAAPTAPNTTTTARQSATATATIFIPARAKSTAANRRSAKWVSPSTQSIEISATRTDGVADYWQAAVTPTSNGCTAVTGGTQCVIPFSAPATTGTQTDTVVVYLYDLPSVIQGSPLASGTAVGVTVTPGASNPLSIQLGGILGQVPAWGSPSVTVTPTTPSQVSYPILGAQDVDGNVIGPTDLLDSPLQITLSDTQTYSLVTPAGGLLAYPSAVVLQYNGTYIPGHNTTLTMESTSMDSDAYYFGGPTPVATTLPY